MVISAVRGDVIVTVGDRLCDPRVMQHMPRLAALPSGDADDVVINSV
jgi:hypothetical protein